MSPTDKQRLDAATLRLQQVRNAIARAKKINGGALRPDQLHLMAELADASTRLAQLEQVAPSAPARICSS